MMIAYPSGGYFGDKLTGNRYIRVFKTFLY